MTNEKETYDQGLNNLEKFGSELSKIEKENNFQVPENYFADLPHLIQERVNNKSKKLDIGTLFYFFMKPKWAIAIGSLVVLLFIAFLFNTNQTQNFTQETFEISFEELMQEYPDMLEYIDDQVLFEFAATQMDQQDLDMMDFDFGIDSTYIQNEVIQHFSDEEVTEFIYNL